MIDNRDEEFWELVRRIEQDNRIASRIRFCMYDLLRDLRELAVLIIVAVAIVATIILVARAVQKHTNNDPRKDTQTCVTTTC